MFTDTASGAVSGLLASTSVGIFGAIAGNAAISGVTYMADQAVQGKDVNMDELIYSTVAGGVGDAIGGSGANATQLEGIWGRSKDVLERAVSPRKIARYNAKLTAIRETIIESIIRSVAGTDSGYVLNTDFFRGSILAGVERK